MTTTPFHLIQGGELHRLQARLHLLPERRFAWLMAAVSWLPLVVLFALDRHVPWTAFFSDLSVHVRSLVGIPVLLAAEPIIDARLERTIERLLPRVEEVGRARLEALASRLMRWSNSSVVDLLLLGLSVCIGLLPIVRAFAWGSDPQNPVHLSYAGVWYAWIVLPVFRFLLFRWAWRVSLWSVFLLRVSRLPLALSPAHPDEAGGLAFLAEQQNGFALLGFVVSAIVASGWETQLLTAGVSAKQYAHSLGVLLLALLVLFLGPLLAFTPKLARARREGKRRYGAVSGRMLERYERRWIDRPDADAGELLDSHNPASLSHHAEVVSIIRRMRVILLNREVVLVQLVAAIVPMIPLALTEIPLLQLLKKLVSPLIR
jgi:hypothetical protein